MVWLSEQQETETILTEVKRANSGKGYILEGEKFDCFIWNSDKILQHLLAAAVAWCDLGQGKQLKIVANKAEKRGFVIEPVKTKGKEVLVAYKLTDRGFTTKAGEVAEEEANPFF
jgi:hypothetical protein